MLFDTDVIIWVQRGNLKAAELINRSKVRAISVLSYMELLQSAPLKAHHRVIKDFLHDFGFSVIPLNENIGHRASIYIEEYSLGHGIRSGDAIVAATAVEHHETLATSNKKHFRCLKDLDCEFFVP
ncbi:MAG: type II toxin-antitoxin system VapC family toxin [Pseudomonadota bacterium]